MRVKTIWLWRNIAKVAMLWALAAGLLIGALLFFDASNSVALIAGVVVGFVTGQIGIAIWPCCDFTIAPSNDGNQR